MKRVTVVLFLILLIGTTIFASTPEPIPRSAYLEFARTSADWTWEHKDSLISSWRKTMDPKSIFGYRPPPRLLEMATIYATLFDYEGNEEYARRAKERSRISSQPCDISSHMRF